MTAPRLLANPPGRGSRSPVMILILILCVLLLTCASRLFADELADLRKAAAQGDAAAQASLGIIYQNGIGVDQDSTKAVEWYQKAAAQGNAEAQYRLGLMYKVGLGGVPKDKGKAFEWDQKAAAQGHAQAQTLLGSEYYLGTFYLRDYSEALKWFMQAAVQGDTAAQYLVGACMRPALAFHKTPCVPTLGIVYRQHRTTLPL